MVASICSPLWRHGRCFCLRRCCMFSFNPDWFVPVYAVCKLTSAIQRTCVTAALSFFPLCTLVITIVPNYYSVLQSEIHMDMEPGSHIASEGVENSQLAKLCSKCRSFVDSCFSDGLLRTAHERACLGGHNTRWLCGLFLFVGGPGRTKIAGKFDESA
jgi:hypothetical protein